MPTVMPDRTIPHRDDYPQDLFDADRGVQLRLRSITGDTIYLSLALFLDDNNGEEVDGPDSFGALVRNLAVDQTHEDASQGGPWSLTRLDARRAAVDL